MRIVTKFIRIMKQVLFNFQTVHDTVNRMMVQTKDPYTIVVSWNSRRIRILKDDSLIDEIDFEEDFTLGDYERLLLSIEESINQLKVFTNDRSEDTGMATHSG